MVTTVKWSAHVSEADVYRWAGMTGDLSPMHVNEEFAATTVTGRRVAHGVLMLVYVLRAAADWAAETGVRRDSAGYDRIRFVRPVFFGDELTIAYSGDPSAPGAPRAVEISNQRDEVVGAATHLVRETG